MSTITVKSPTGSFNQNSPRTKQTDKERARDALESLKIDALNGKLTGSDG